jgi:hypothetical protein
MTGASTPRLRRYPGKPSCHFEVAQVLRRLGGLCDGDTAHRYGG